MERQALAGPRRMGDEPRAAVPVKEYEQLATRFNPVKFDADAWVQLAQGRRHEIHRHHVEAPRRLRDVQVERRAPTTSSTRRRSSATSSKELADACAQRRHRASASTTRSRRTGTSATAPGTTWDFGPDDKKDYDQYLRGKAEPQVKELLTNYGTGGAHLVRHAAHDDRRSRAALRRHRAHRRSPTR